MTTASVEFRDTRASLSQTLRAVAGQLPAGEVTLREIIALIGEQGMLFFCILLTVPFLTPIPLPGASTVLGGLIGFVSIGIILNRVPWLPVRVLNRRVSSAQLSAALARGAGLFARLERFIRPRWPALTRDATTNRINGLAVLVGGLLLMLPIPFLPLSNMMPAYGVFFLAAGMLQRDGLFVILGHLLVIATVVYFVLVALALLVAGQGIAALFAEAAIFFPLR